MLKIVSSFDLYGAVARKAAQIPVIKNNWI